MALKRVVFEKDKPEKLNFKRMLWNKSAKTAEQKNLYKTNNTFTKVTSTFIQEQVTT